MIAPRDGGPAFPTPYYSGSDPEEPGYGWEKGGDNGMTLRDWFAGQALAGELASQSAEVGEWPESHADNLATRCYAMADAMLKARKETTDE